jgi:hypothetical protein
MGVLIIRDPPAYRRKLRKISILPLKYQLSNTLPVPEHSDKNKMNATFPRHFCTDGRAYFTRGYLFFSLRRSKKSKWENKRYRGGFSVSVFEQNNVWR